MNFMRYYTCANTSGGFVDFTEENVFDIENKVQLICKNEYVKSYILGFLNGESEKIISVGSRNLTDGLIFRNKNAAVVSNCKNPYKVFDLDKYFGFADGEEIEYYNSMLNFYEDAKEIHDEWESIYIKNMDFERLNNFCKNIIERLVGTESANGTGKTYKRFFGTVTPGGNVNYIDDLTENMEKRFFIKGRPGTGKSTFLKKLSAKLRENDYDVEEYYCSFDSNSLDMVICRELSFCVFDSTPPHEKFPQKETDEILDFYIESGLTGVDEANEKDLYFVKSAYDFKIKEGKKCFEKLCKIKEERDKKGLAKIEESEMRKIGENIKSAF